jgi:hypothetical protein
MAPTPQAASSARIVKLDASQNLVKSEKPKKAGKPQAAGDKQKKRKAGQQASSDDESEEEIVSFGSVKCSDQRRLKFFPGLCQCRPGFLWFH